LKLSKNLYLPIKIPLTFPFPKCGPRGIFTSPFKKGKLDGDFYL